MGIRMTYEDCFALGWPVFPVGLDKKPLVPWKPYQNRMPTEQEVAVWKTKFPNAGLGCPTGPFSKLFVIDIDGQKGLDSIEKMNLTLPLTRIAKTPRGYHYFFKWNVLLEKYITTISDIQPGIDIRGKGGYVVIPSLAMPDREWKIIEDNADVPESYYELFPHSSTNGKGPLNMADKIAGMDNGNRHQTFLSLAGKLMSAKMEKAEIIATLMPLAEEHNFEHELFALINDMTTRYAVVPRKQFSIEPVEKLLEMPEPALEWMIEGLWTAKSKGLLVGLPNLGKTWVAIDMLISFVTGLPCLGKFIPSHTGNGLLVEQEGSLLNLNRRFHMMAKGRGLSAHSLKNLHHMSFQFPKLPDHEADIIRLMKEHNIQFAVFDSLVRYHDKDENSAKEMRLVLESFTRVNLQTDASILLIHHLGKASEAKRDIWERIRGTSDLVAWRDCIMALQGEPGDDVCELSFQFRDAENPGPVQIRRTLNETTGAITLTTLNYEDTEEFKDRLAKVHQVIKVNFGVISKDLLAKKIGGKKMNSLKFIKTLLDKKLLVQNEEGIFVPL